MNGYETPRYETPRVWKNERSCPSGISQMSGVLKGWVGFLQIEMQVKLFQEAGTRC